MALAQDLLSGLAEDGRFGGPHALLAKRMFSGAAMSCLGLPFAMVIGGTLYVRVDASMRESLTAMGATPFRYRTRVREVTVASYLSAPDALLDDTQTWRDWAWRAVKASAAAHDASSRPKARSPRKASKSPG